MAFKQMENIAFFLLLPRSTLQNQSFFRPWTCMRRKIPTLF
ncbi:hypothetical protein ANCCEY_06424 [Ancylostoma ceylanicum]|uniref:Uncharacterized protein n=1 Tax=Ancylostoma ceylanicum TaxID=53326 RepID=A0A0D6LWK1_9BILA|nr:hypothetical protein ANCCEY_06424 [Ancylostoma ceylanicum]